MKVLVFDIKAPVGHFKRPDATATHLTYPFITRTAIRGLLGAVIGLEKFDGDALIGIQLINPVQTVAQELSLLGKGYLSSGPSFHRLTAQELVVNPHYRIYYTGVYYDQIVQAIKSSKSHYHTYMGSAFAPTFPIYMEELELPEESAQRIDCLTVVPTGQIEQLVFEENVSYARVGGMHYQYLGERIFRGTINLIYEIKGRKVYFRRRQQVPPEAGKLLRIEGKGCICLW